MGKRVMKPLTDKDVAALKPDPERRYSRAVGVVDGLLVNVMPSGAKSFSVQYWMNGTKAKITLPKGFPTIGVKHAREAAKAIMGDVAKGSDVAAERRVKRQAVTHTLSAVSWAFIVRYHIGMKALTADEARRLIEAGPRRETPEKQREWDKGLRDKLEGADVHSRGWWEIWRTFATVINPALGARALAMITTKDVVQMVDRVASERGETTGRRAFAYLRKLFRWAKSHSIVAASPCADIAIKEIAGQDNRGTRTLTDDEIRLVWRATERLDAWRNVEGEIPDRIFRDYVRLLIITGQRRREVAGMRRSELKEGGKLWVIPADRMKGKLAHTVALPPLAQQILAGRPELGDHLFSTGMRGDRPINCFNDVKHALDASILAILKEEAKASGDDPDNVQPPEHFTLHDLRRTMRTVMSKLKVDSEIGERCLAHLPGGIRKTYDVWEFLDEKRDAWERWAKHIMKLVGVSAAKTKAA